MIVLTEGRIFDPTVQKMTFYVLLPPPPNVNVARDVYPRPRISMLTNGYDMYPRALAPEYQCWP